MMRAFYPLNLLYSVAGRTIIVAPFHCVAAWGWAILSCLQNDYLRITWPFYFFLRTCPGFAQSCSCRTVTSRICLCPQSSETRRMVTSSWSSRTQESFIGSILFSGISVPPPPRLGATRDSSKTCRVLIGEKRKADGKRVNNQPGGMEVDKRWNCGVYNVILLQKEIYSLFLFFLFAPH